jgi:Carboxypeptidase regulatory-like domain
MRVHSRKQAAHLLVMLTILAIVLQLARPWPVQAQAVGATLSGVVTDSSGAAIPNATVSIKNEGTRDAREQTTNGDGIYSAPNLIPGLYEVSVTAAGFRKLVQPAITLTVGAQRGDESEP